jgi:hypothetical protein
VQPFAIVVVSVALVLLFGRLFASRLLLVRYQDGRITGPTMLILLAAITIGPYLLIALWAVSQAPESWWIWLLLLVASWPIIVLPVVALYQQAKQNRREPDL